MEDEEQMPPPPMESAPPPPEDEIPGPPPGNPDTETDEEGLEDDVESENDHVPPLAPPPEDDLPERDRAVSRALDILRMDDVELPDRNSPAAGSSKSIGGISKKSTCAFTGCMQFEVREGYCLRHVWKSYYDPVVWEPTEQTQFKVAQEIVSTEKSYYEGISKAVNVFLRRLRIYNDLGRPLLTPKEIDSVFTNLEEVMGLTEKMYLDMADIAKEILVKQIGATLLHYSSNFRVYQAYLEGYDRAAVTLHEIRSRNPDFDFFLKVNEKAENSSLESLLIMPVQRLPRYLLLLAELKKRTNDGDECKEDLNAAHEKIAIIASAINQSLHSKEHTAKLRDIADLFEKDDRYVELVVPGRVFIREGKLIKAFSKGSKHIGKSKSYQFFLFSDVLVYAEEAAKVGKKKYKLKYSLPLSTMMITRDHSKKNNKFSIIGEKGKSFTVKAETTNQREEWFADLSKAIDESRNPGLVNIENFDGKAKTTRANTKYARLMGV